MSIAIPETTSAPAGFGGAEIAAWAQAASDAARLVSPLVKTDFVPAHFRGNVEAATAAVLYGAEAGLSPMQALQGVYVISGRPAMYSRTMLAIVLGKGHEVWVEDASDARVVVCGRRRGSERVERSIWTIERARKAGYLSNKKYTTDPMAMLTARGHADICRRIAADALLGMSYTVEELEDEAATKEPTSSGGRTVKRVASKKAAAPRPVSAPVEAPPLPGEVPDPRETGEQITRAQSTKLHATLGDLGIKDRGQGLALLSALAGRALESSNDLTVAEASGVIERLVELQEKSQREQRAEIDRLVGRTGAAPAEAVQVEEQMPVEDPPGWDDDSPALPGEES